MGDVRRCYKLPKLGVPNPDTSGGRSLSPWTSVGAEELAFRLRCRGISRALAGATVDFARQRGARALEGYPMITQRWQEVMLVELHVGSRSIYADAGFAEVSRPTLRRVMMRIDF